MFSLLYLLDLDGFVLCYFVLQKGEPAILFTRTDATLMLDRTSVALFESIAEEVCQLHLVK
jgi:hypothetical protein